MPTAVEHGDEYYTRAVADARGIPAGVANAVVAMGHGIAIGQGKSRYQHPWTSPTGLKCWLVVIAQGGKILSAYVSFQEETP